MSGSVIQVQNERSGKSAIFPPSDDMTCLTGRAHPLSTLAESGAEASYFRFAKQNSPRYAQAMTAISKCPATFVETDVDDEVVIVSLDKGQFFSLKDTGLAIWKKIDGRKDRDAILNELVAEYDASAETLSRDLDAFLAQVGAAGFIA